MNHIIRTLCILTLCLGMTACFKEQDKKVIAKADEATKTVQVDKVAADMANAAEILLTSNTAQPVETSELRSVKCLDGSGAVSKVVTYLPRTASVAKNGRVAGNIAQRMRTELQSKFKPENVTDAAGVDPSCGIDTATIAVNSPVLVLDNNFAEAQDTPDDTAQVVSVDMRPCGVDANGKQIPGVIITKHYRDGTVGPEESHCGAAAPDDVTDIAVNTNAAMPDWKNRLVGGNILAEQNFTCVAGQNGCNPPPSGEMGVQIICPDAPQKTELMVNPTYDNATADFAPSALDRDCGRGWKGELIGRIKKKTCKVIRDGVESTPATIFDVAYVGARCEKRNAEIEDECPAGTTFAFVGTMVTAKDLTMRAPISLIPTPSTTTPGTNQSQLSYFDTDPNGVVHTNADSPTQAFVNQPQTVVRAPTADNPATTMTANLFFPRPDMNALPSVFRFDNTFVRELVALDKANIVPRTCFTQAQNCMNGQTPKMISVVVDRSGSMGAITPNILPKQTSCRATMANLFRPDKRVAACTAAKAWQTIAQDRLQIRQEAISRWNYNHEPVYQGSAIYDQIIAEADAFIQQSLAPHEAIMHDGLVDSNWIPRLHYGLALGQDCYPAAVQDDMFGSCAPVHATKAELTTADFTKGPLRTCQSTCPGECITDAVQRRNAANQLFVRTRTQSLPTPDYIPVEGGANRMLTVDSFIQGNLISNLPPGMKFYYIEFINSNPDNTNSTNVGAGPVELDLTDPNNPNNNSMDMSNRSFWSKKVAEKLKAKFDARGGNMGGVTPLFETTDRGIDRLRTQLLDKPAGPNTGPDQPAILAMMTDGDDNGDPSGYFGRNLCTPELKPQKYMCEKTVCCKRILGICFKHCDETMDVDLASVKATKKIVTPGTKWSWCNDRGYGNDVIKVVAPGETRMEQVDSLVGILGANYPNTKAYYLDIGNTTIGAQCNDPDKQIYPGPDAPIAEQKKVLHVFRYDDSAADEMYKAFNQMMGGGPVDPEVGRRVCELKWGSGITISQDVPPNTPLSNLNYNTQQASTCEGATYLNVNAPPGSPVLPPDYIPNPYIPPAGQGPYTPQENCHNTSGPNGSPSTYGRVQDYTLENCP